MWSTRRQNDHVTAGSHILIRHYPVRERTNNQVYFSPAIWKFATDTNAWSFCYQK